MDLDLFGLLPILRNESSTSAWIYGLCFGTFRRFAPGAVRRHGRFSCKGMYCNEVWLKLMIERLIMEPHLLPKNVRATRSPVGCLPASAVLVFMSCTLKVAAPSEDACRLSLNGLYHGSLYYGSDFNPGPFPFSPFWKLRSP